MSESSDIAIVGIGCRFPGANNSDEFWRVLSRGENHVVEIPNTRWNVDAFYDEDPVAPGKSYCRKAGLVHGFVKIIYEKNAKSKFWKKMISLAINVGKRISL